VQFGTCLELYTVCLFIRVDESSSPEEMALVTSLGLHQPTGLPYAIQEGLVPADSTSTSYEWLNRSEGEGPTSYHEDELLVTPRCVIWSRGGVFRKSYKFDLEKEEVTQALLTSFPSVGPLAGKQKKAPQKEGDTNNRETAVVVFLKTQAHVYFLSGTSHVIHLPFEVESAIAAPNGLIIQRKVRVDNLVPASLKFPRVPPNSFVSSQPQPWSAASSLQSTFSIADLGSPKQMPMPHSTLKDMWDPPSLKIDTNWPRLFSLSDPLAEMGLVVAQPATSEKHGHRRSSTKLSALDTSEEILHVSHQTELSNSTSERPLTLALTVNRETSMYTVWRFAYVGGATLASSSEKYRAPSGTMSRRRSSFMPGTATGATTPVMNGQQTFRDSFIDNPNPVGGGKKKTTLNEESRDKVPDFASSLDPDFENTSIPRRKSRRVSSMLARADLSASNERSAFSDLATGHQHAPTRRTESLGSQQARTSIGGFAGMNGPTFAHPTQLNNSLNGFLEAPVDDLLDELRAGGDFEGFHNMGLDDDEFDTLKQEIVLTKICSVPVEHENIRYSSQHVPAASQCRIFTLSAPASAADDKQGNAVVVCVLDPDEKKLLVLTLYAKTQNGDDHTHHRYINGMRGDRDMTSLSLGPVMRAKGVIDACRIDDGLVSRILVLTETPDGYGELSLQAPWSVLMKVPLPAKFILSNSRNLSYNPTPRFKRESGLNQVLSQGPRALCGLRNSKPRGLFDLVDEEGKMHQLRILLQPRNPYVCRILELCRVVLSSGRGGEGILVCWWNVMQWLRLESVESEDQEWTALVVTILALPLSLSSVSKPSKHHVRPPPKPRRGHLRSSSGAQSENWELMIADEAPNGNPIPTWANNSAWSWLVEDGTNQTQTKNPDASSHFFSSPSSDQTAFIPTHVKLTRQFMHTTLGRESVFSNLPTSGIRASDSRKSALVDIIIAFHLLLEEEKLDTTTTDAFNAGKPSLTPVLAQVVKWMKWSSWIEYYEAEDNYPLDLASDTGTSYQITTFPFILTSIAELQINVSVSQPFECPTIYHWIQSCLRSRGLAPFMTLQELANRGSLNAKRHSQAHKEWFKLTPRTLIFMQFFRAMQAQWTPAQYIEALSSAGADLLFLETLPEAVLAPLQEAIVQCQTEPPLQWSKELLALVKREDVNMLLIPGQRPRQTQSTLLVI
jgi:anaphase-promoting complex subunit 1